MEEAVQVVEREVEAVEGEGREAASTGGKLPVGPSSHQVEFLYWYLY